MKIQTFKKSIYTASAGTTLLATKVFAQGQNVAGGGANAVKGNLTGVKVKLMMAQMPLRVTLPAT